MWIRIDVFIQQILPLQLHTWRDIHKLQVPTIFCSVTIAAAHVASRITLQHHFIKQCGSIVKVGIWGTVDACHPKCYIQNHSIGILHDTNYLYEIILSLKQKNTFRQLNMHHFNSQTQNLVCPTHRLTHDHLVTSSLTMVTSLETTQSNEWPQIYATIVNSLVGCAFWGSDECAPSAPCIFFYFPLGCFLQNHIEALIFFIKTFHIQMRQHYLQCLHYCKNILYSDMQILEPTTLRWINIQWSSTIYHSYIHILVWHSRTIGVR